MPRRLARLCPLALAVLLALPATAQEPADPATVVARVNGEEITLGHMIVAFASLPQRFQQLPADQLFDGILEQLIQQTALMQSFDGDVPPHVTLSLENERRSLMAGAEIETVMQDAVSEDDLAALYAERYESGPGQVEYDASHILVATEDEAAAIVEILEGGADFAATAQERSTGPTGPSGGALGWFGAGQMVPSFEAAVAELQPGEISGPVQTRFGWHVIRLNDRRVAEAPDFEAVREDLAQELRSQAVEDHVERVTRLSDVERIDTGLPVEAVREIDLIRTE